MHEALKGTQERLHTVIEQLQSTVPNDEPFSNAHNNWSFPGVSRAELVEEVQSIVQFIDDHETDDIGESETRIADYQRRLDHLASQTVPNIWNQAGQAVPAFQLTIDGLRKLLSSSLARDERAEYRKRLLKLGQELRGMEAQLNGLNPRTDSLAEMVGRIEQAYNAADRLPTDLESLAEARQSISRALEEARYDQKQTQDVRQDAQMMEHHLKKSAEQAQSVLDRCETAYAAATSVGLAAAFDERSTTLSRSMWFWIGGLAVALAAGSFLGSTQLRALSETFSVSGASGSVVVLNVLLAILSVGASV